MTIYTKPCLPIPEPLRGAEIGSFAHYTVTVRLPNIARQVLAENAYPQHAVAGLETLINEIPAGPIRPLNDGAAPDSVEWAGFLAPYLGWNWLDITWLFAEAYFYRRILEAVGYFESGPGQGRDPYTSQKRQGLERDLDTIRAFCTQVKGWVKTAQNEPARLPEVLEGSLKVNLWGNQADLSMWPIGKEKPGSKIASAIKYESSKKSSRPDHDTALQQEDHLLVDDAEDVAGYLASLADQPVRVDLILDNAGLELVYDLGLADFLLSSQVAREVYFHLKSFPTFVSDATIADVRQTVSFLVAEARPDVRALAVRLKGYLDDGRLHLQDGLYWTSPLSFWEAPSHMIEELSHSDLLISKGDANYRRLLGDRHWPYITPLADILCYLPAPLAALRVLKSEVAAGLKPGQPESLDRTDPGWKTNGKWGVLQFVRV